MNPVIASLLWAAGRELGAELLDRVDHDPTLSGNDNEPLPPALIESAVRNGRTEGVVGPYRPGRWQVDRPGDPLLLLRLLRRDDPEVNAALFEHSEWPALKRWILEQQLYEDEPVLLPLTSDQRNRPAAVLSPRLREKILRSGNHHDLRPALSAYDPDLVFWALANNLPTSEAEVLRGFLTLSYLERFAQIRFLKNLLPDEIKPKDLHALLQPSLQGSRLRDAFKETRQPEHLNTKLRTAHKATHGRALLSGHVRPDWPCIHRALDEEPFPWGASVALLEHPLCPADVTARILETHPGAATFIRRPGPEVLSGCVARGDLQTTKQVLLNGIAAGTLSDTDLLTLVRPAKLAITALRHGALTAVATQAATAVRVRALLSHTVREPKGWARLFAALPTYEGPLAALLADPPEDTALPDTPGRQAAWAYTVLLDLAGPDHTADALTFLDDLRLAPLAGAPDAPLFLLDHVREHGGPISQRVLAGTRPAEQPRPTAPSLQKQPERRAAALALLAPHSRPYRWGKQGLEYERTLNEPVLDWDTLTQAAADNRVHGWLRRDLAERPDVPVEFARRILRGSIRIPGEFACHHRQLVLELLPGAPLLWSNVERVLDAGTITPAEFIATGRAGEVVALCSRRPDVARGVAALLHGTLGRNPDAWAVLARILTDDPDATLPELTSTASAITT